jgi:hypothetical protein
LKQVLDLHDPAGSNTKQFRLALYKSEKQLARLQEQQQAIERAIKALSGMMRIVSRTLAKRTVAPTGSAR